MTDVSPALPEPALPSKPVKHRALIAAATRIGTEPGAPAAKQLGKRQAWQDDAWAYFHEVPEVQFATSWLSNVLSRVVFFAGYELDDGSIIPVGAEKSPIRSTKLASDATYEMSRLKADKGGQSRINAMATLNIEVDGECFLHGQDPQPAKGVPGTSEFKEATPETWSIRSVSMIAKGKNKDAAERPTFEIKMDPDDQARVVDNDTEALIRIWQEDPQWTNLAHCHLRACLSDCELLILLTNQQKAEAKSRQAPGLLLIPSELSFSDDPEDDDTGGETSEQPAQNPFIKALSSALTEPIEDPSSPGAVTPLVISAPAEFLKPEVFRLLSFARVADATLDARIEAKINRLARGLNVPVEVVMGHMSTTFSNAEQIDEDKFKDHAQPRCDMLGDAYEYGFLIPNLAALGYDEVALERIRVGYEAGAVTASVSAEENADALWEAGAISYATYRRLKGATEDDAPSDEEFLVQLAARKGIFTSDLTTIVMQKGGVDLGATVNADSSQATVIEDGSAPAPAPKDAPAEDPPPPPPEGDAQTASGAPRPPQGKPSKLGRQLAAIDRKLRAQLQGAVEAAMGRALERAGNRLKNNGRAVTASGGLVRDVVAKAPPYRAGCDLGRHAMTAAGIDPDDLLEGAWSDFAQQFKLWTAQGGEEALDLVSGALGGMSTSARDAAKLRQLTGIEEAWGWLSNALGDVGREVLFNPERGALAALESLGEFATDMRIPPGLIREALAIAGGTHGLRGPNGIVHPSNNTPVGGIATGDDTMGVLADGGAYVNGYVWVYGPGRRRTFEPHAVLDGTAFENFDDAALVNTAGWPETAFFYPGDHAGCLCDFEPFIIPPADGDAVTISGSPLTPKEASDGA